MHGVRRMAGAAMAVLAAFALALGAASAARADCSVGLIATFPVTMQGRQPLVPARINGQEVQFIADSGAFFSMISPGPAQALHLRLESLPFGFIITGVGGEVTPSLTTVDRLGLATSNLRSIQFIVGGSGMAAPAVGLLGQNVWALGDVDYDLSNGFIKMMKPHGCGRLAMVYWTHDKPYSVMDIEGMGGGHDHTVGRAKVNGRSVEVTFDTGADTSVLSLDAARRAGIRPDGPGVIFAGYSGGIGRKLVKTWIAPVDSFKIGDEEIKHTHLRLGELGPDTDMLLGADFFLSHHVFVANSQRKLYFTYNGGPVFDLHVDGEGAPGAAGPAVALAAAGGGAAPTDAAGFATRGAAEAGRGEFSEALADDDRAVELAPAEPRYLLQRARLHLAKGEPALARLDLDAALKLKGDDPDARLLRAGLRLRDHDRDGARTDLDAASASLPKEAEERLQFAQGYLALEAYDRAVAEFDPWIAVHEDDSRLAIALNGRCWARALANEALDKALSDCNRAVRIAAVKANALDSRALVRLRRGELAQALADYDAALALAPRSAWSLYGRSLVEAHMGDAAKAQADRTAAVAIEPDLAARGVRLGLEGGA